MQGVWDNNSRQEINVTGVMAVVIGHISAQHLQDEADKVEDAEDVVKDREIEEAEAEEVDNQAGWPGWCSRSQLL